MSMRDYCIVYNRLSIHTEELADAIEHGAQSMSHDFFVASRERSNALMNMIQHDGNGFELYESAIRVHGRYLSVTLAKEKANPTR